MITASQVAQWEIDIKYFRDQLESLRAERDSLRTENATLRELVREALALVDQTGVYLMSVPAQLWRQRAEKALNGTL